MTDASTITTPEPRATDPPGAAPRRQPRRKRKIALVLLLGIGLSGWLGYRYVTKPEYLSATLAYYLAEWIEGEIHIGAIQFDLMQGLSLSNVSWEIPRTLVKHSDVDPSPDTTETVFSAELLHVDINWIAALKGKLPISHVKATRPTFVVEWENDTEQYNWQHLLLPQDEDDDDGSTPKFPFIEFEAAQLRVRRGNETPEAEKLLTLDITAAPTPLAPNQVDIKFRSHGESGETGLLRFDMDTGRLDLTAGELPALPIRRTALIVPVSDDKLLPWIEMLGLQGRIGVDELSLDPKRQNRVQLTLRDASFSIPLDEDEHDLSFNERYLYFTDVNGTAALDGNRARAVFDGSIAGTVCHVEATIERTGERLQNIDDVSFDLSVSGHRFQIPRRDDPARPSEARLVNKWRRIKRLFELYDPHGVIDFKVRVTKPGGSEAEIELEHGLFTMVDADGAFENFPYRLYHLTGEVEVHPGAYYLRNLTGTHGPGRAVISGLVYGPHRYSGLELDIRATNIPLNPTLFTALPERYRGIWTKLAPDGLASFSVYLNREDGTADNPFPLRTEIDAQLVETRMVFSSFPFNIEGIEGRLHITNEGMEFTNLKGGHDQGSVAIDGWAAFGQDQGRKLEMRLQAANIALDQDLADALPPKGQDAFDSLAPNGQTDMMGRIFIPPTDGESTLEYDFYAGLRNASVQYTEIPIRINELTGLLRFRPGKIDVQSLQGARGDSQITLRATFDTTQGNRIESARMTCRGLRLDSEMMDALPPAFDPVKEKFTATGKIDLDLRLSDGDSANPADRQYRAVIRALGNDVTYDDFPLPLRDVQGTVIVSADKAEFLELSAYSGDGRITLSGQFDIGPETQSGGFRVTARDMVFDEALRQALPWRLRRRWNDLEPQGGFDLNLDSLTFERRTGAPETAKWSFDGQWTFKDAQLNLGFEAKNLQGTFIGNGATEGENNQFSIHGRFDLEQARIGERMLKNVYASITKPIDDATLVVEDLTAEAYGGRLAGYAEITMENRYNEYSISIVGRDMRLGDMLNETRPDDQKLDLKGLVETNFFISGQSDSPENRRGGGKIVISQAQVFKIPLLISILQIGEIPVEDINAFSTVESKFFMSGDQMMIDRIELRGDSLAMLGEGKMKWNDKSVDLRLYSVSALDLPRLPLLTELLEGASRELMEFQVVGKLEDPRITARPLSRIEGRFRELLRGAK
jgi:hypothetical protein